MKTEYIIGCPKCDKSMDSLLSPKDLKVICTICKREYIGGLLSKKYKQWLSKKS